VAADGLVELADAIAVVREQLVEAQLAGRRVFWPQPHPGQQQPGRLHLIAAR
jgi:hypothetical protein